jgi:hypothetical protein
MRKVKEYLNEKFEEQSDPISDMSVGGIAFGVLRYEMKQDFKKQFNDKLHELLEGKTVTGIMNQNIIMRKNPKTDSLETSTGKGWRKYTIKIDSLPTTLDIDDLGIPVYIKSGKNEVTGYIIPFNESKIYISK